MRRKADMSPVFRDIGIKGYRIVSTEEKETFRVNVELEREPTSCPCCAGGRLRSKGRYERRVRHLDCFWRRATMVVRCRRLRCMDCERTFVPPLPGIRPWRQSSEPFRRRLFEWHHAGICASNLATEQRIGAATVNRIYAQFTRLKAAERISRLCPRVLGIDEHSLHRSAGMVTTFCDLKRHRVFDVVPGRSISDLRGFLKTLKGKEKVAVVCIDLSSPYRNMIKRFFPNARIVADRFHVVRIIYQHMISLARSIAPDLKHHRGYLACMRKRPEELSEPQKRRLDELFKRHPALQPLYEQMHQLRQLMNRKNCTRKQCRKPAHQLLWHINQLKRSGLAALQRLAQTLQSWAEPIACMWRFSKNNAITEGFHRKMKLIQRRAYGFRNFENYRLRVIAQCG